MKNGRIFLLLVFGILLNDFNGSGQTTFDPMFSNVQRQSWSDVKKIATAEGKLIFVDCFATWCGPCKKMDADVFSSDIVQQYFKDHFVSVKVQMDSMPSDSPKTIYWRSQLLNILGTENISAFPTFLLINSQGILLTKMVGAVYKPEAFLTGLKEAGDSSNFYFMLKQKYLNGDRETNVINKLLRLAHRNSDTALLFRLHNDYFDNNTDSLFTQDVLTGLYLSMSKSTDKGFAFFLKNAKRINQALKEDDRAESVIRSILIRELFASFVINSSTSKATWEAIEERLQKIAPTQKEWVLINLKLLDAFRRKEWNLYGSFTMDYYDQFAKSFSHNDLFWMNNTLWEIFKKCSAESVLLRAAGWSKWSTNNTKPGIERPESTDTYANLLYKSGQKDEAIKWEEKAIEKAKAINEKDLVKEFNIVLEKMKAGIPTWPTTN